MKKIIGIGIVLLFFVATFQAYASDNLQKNNEKESKEIINFDEIINDIILEHKSTIENSNIVYKEYTPDIKLVPDVSYYEPGEIIVCFKKCTDISYKESIDSYKILDKIEDINVAVIQVEEGLEKDCIDYFEGKEDVYFAEYNLIYPFSEVHPSDTYYQSRQWGPQNIKCPIAWESNKGSNSIVIAIVDSGVDFNHPDLKYKCVRGRNFVGISFYPMDYLGHGTHCAGIAAASTNNNRGIAGVSWKCKIMPIKAGNIVVRTIAAYRGIIWATNHGANIISMSWGSASPSNLIYSACQYAYNKDVFLCAASGNEYTDSPCYPAAYSIVVSVGAIDEDNKRCSFSNYGDWLDLVAPGEHIYSTVPNNQYDYYDGTSMACPHVAGVAALYYSDCSYANPVNCRWRLINSADDLGDPGKDDYYGYGRVDASLNLND